MSDDYMETASGLVPQADGWWLDTTSGNKIAPTGQIVNAAGDIIGQVTFEEDEEE